MDCLQSLKRAGYLTLDTSINKAMARRKRIRPGGGKPLVADGVWENAHMGMGTRRDRTSYSKVGTSYPLDRSVLTDLYCDNGFARRIVDSVADDAVRAGFTISSPKVSDVDKILSDIEEHRISESLCSAMKWARLYGGAAIVMVLNDGAELLDPLSIESVDSIDELKVYDRHQINVHQRYIDLDGSNLGKPEAYQITPSAPQEKPYFVHESRVLVFDGDETPASRRSANGWWGSSALQKCYTELKNLGTANWYSLEILSRGQQPVHKIPNLTQVLKDEETSESVRKRIDLLDMARSLSNTVVIDALEEFEIKNAGNIGCEQIVNGLGRALSAVSGIPECILFGTSPKGLSATGDADLQNYYKSISAIQESTLKRPLSFLVDLLLHVNGHSNAKFTIKFNPLYMPSAKEIAETSAAQAKADVAYVDAQVIGVKEMRDTLRKEGRYVLSDSDVVEAPVGS
jgi:phage-related protein (TIGR01555 family)